MTKLDIPAMVNDLSAAGVRYVLTGSVAAAAYGVPVEPRDLDIAPALDPENLARLAGLLRRWSAKPVPDPDWPQSLTPEACEHWVPDPPTAEHLDHLMATPHGSFDVVPSRSCTYSDLIQRALPLPFEGRTIRVAHPDDLIAALRLHKPKHQARLPYLEAIRERIRRDGGVAMKLPGRIAPWLSSGTDTSL